MTIDQSENNGHQDGGEPIGELVTIRQRGRVWYANFQHEGKQIRQSLKTRSKKEARRKAIRLEADIMEGRFKVLVAAPPIKLTTDAYLAYLKTERKAVKTVQKCELVVRRVLDLAERRKATTLLDINLRFVDAYRTERVEADAMPKTVLNETVIIRQIVNFALEREQIMTDPLKRLKLKKVKPTTQPCWTRTQVDQILALAEGPHKPALVILAEEGMRVGELKHLTWDDIDFERGVLHVRPKPGWQPKTGDQRAIPMTPAVRQLLDQLPRNSTWVVTAAPSKLYPKGGHQISERRLLLYLKRLLKKLKLVGHLHTFRHSFISNAITHGTPEAIVRQWVGHVDADILKLYTHINDAASQEAMQRLAANTDQDRQKRQDP